jgi:tetratricopeptide (TPR) repeat protein
MSPPRKQKRGMLCLIVMDPHERSILAAQGYLELGMFRDVWRELHGLPAKKLGRTDVLEILALSLMGEGRWQEALEVARRLRDTDPAEPGGYIHEAYCLHELGNTQQALDTLLQGPKTLHEKPVFFYNAACYQARLGNLEGALAMLNKSFEMDANLRLSAKRDPDLVGVRKLI